MIPSLDTKFAVDADNSQHADALYGDQPVTPNEGSFTHEAVAGECFTLLSCLLSGSRVACEAHLQLPAAWQVAPLLWQCVSGRSTRRCALLPHLGQLQVQTHLWCDPALTRPLLCQADGKPVNHQLAKEVLAGLVRLCCC